MQLSQWWCCLPSVCAALRYCPQTKGMAFTPALRLTLSTWAFFCIFFSRLHWKAFVKVRKDVVFDQNQQSKLDVFSFKILLKVKNIRKNHLWIGFMWSYATLVLVRWYFWTIITVKSFPYILSPKRLGVAIFGISFHFESRWKMLKQRSLPWVWSIYHSPHFPRN